MTNYECEIKEIVKENIEDIENSEEQILHSEDFFEVVPSEEIKSIKLINNFNKSISDFKPLLKNFSKSIEDVSKAFYSMRKEMIKCANEAMLEKGKDRDDFFGSVYTSLKQSGLLPVLKKVNAFPSSQIDDELQKLIDKENEENLCEVEIRTNPTLEEIREKTEGFTLFERVPGLLFRNHEDENFFHKGLNAPVVCRVRYLLRDLKEEMEVTKGLGWEKSAGRTNPNDVLKKCLDTAYKEYPIIDTNNKGHFYTYHYEEKDFKSNYIKYSIFLNTGFNESVLMDFSLRHNCQLTGSI